jgi:superkiller protein 3
MIKENYEEAARQYQMVLPLVTSPQQLESALSEWTETLTKTGQVEEETKALEAAVEQPTADPWCHVQLLKLYQVAGRTGDAARLVERLAAADLAWPAKEKVFRWAHQVVLSFTEPHEFVPAYERAFAGVDDSIQSHLWRADLYERLGQEEQVVAALEKARTMEPENTPILQRLGAAYERLGQPEQARDVYQSWLRLDRHNVGVRLSLARTLVALGKPEEAYAVLPMPEEFKIQSLLDYGPGHKARTRREYLAQYAQRIRELGLLERAIADYEKEAAARPEEAVFPALLNFLYLEADTPEKAVEPLLKSLIQRGPVSHWDEFELLWPRWEKEGREETALRLLERMVFDPQVGEYPRGNYIDKLVALYRRLEQIPAGVQRVQQALTAAPGDRVLLRLLAQLEQLQGKRGAALEVQEELADRHPDDPQSYVELGRAYRQAGRLNEAIAAWEKAVELQPKNGAAWERLGAAYAQADRVEDTIRAYEEALKVVPLKHLARARISEALTQLQAHRGRRAPTSRPCSWKSTNNLTTTAAVWPRARRCSPLVSGRRPSDNTLRPSASRRTRLWSTRCWRNTSCSSGFPISRPRNVSA